MDRKVSSCWSRKPGNLSPGDGQSVCQLVQNSSAWYANINGVLQEAHKQLKDFALARFKVCQMLRIPSTSEPERLCQDRNVSSASSNLLQSLGSHWVLTLGDGSVITVITSGYSSRGLGGKLPQKRQCGA